MPGSISLENWIFFYYGLRYTVYLPGDNTLKPTENWSIHHWILFSQAVKSKFWDPMASLIFEIYPTMGYTNQYVYQEDTQMEALF